MSLPPLDPTTTDRLRIVAWPDPVIDLLGHEPRSGYVERFWLPILGPTTTLLLRRLAAGFDGAPDGFDLPTLETAAALGLGSRGGRNSPFLRALGRAAKFKIIRLDLPDTLAVRRHVPPLTRTQVARLPEALRSEHEEWQAAVQPKPGIDHQRRRARRLALSLIELGEPDEAVERQLHRWQLHPAVAHEALTWARDHRKQAEASAPTPSPAPAPARTASPTPTPTPAPSRASAPSA